MILVLNLNRREQDEVMQALYDHKRALGRYNVPGRYKTTQGVIGKLDHAREEAAKRPPAASK